MDMESLASQAKPAAVLWLAGFLQAARLHRVVSFCVRSRPLSIRIAQCFLLNGFIFLGRGCSYLLIHTLCPYRDILCILVLSALHLQLHIKYSLVWTLVLPSSRYNDIAKHALDVVKCKSPDATKALDAHTISESIDRPEGFDGVAIGIGEQLYSILLLTIFFVEVSVIGYIPYFGKALNFLLLSLMYAYYCFEYKWNFFAVSLNNRLDFFESNWAFFAGFGMLMISH
ncbi:hypothetical protein GUJ93_ZPchr0004g40207 [Zizania palustris]|uniref:Uncharacterized protein n=1 Tax=Zizania palustris TaxID=103762 RepID=A0A8J5RYJ6_ZIZPA|nr:hypothetical protein GUJ93_ZPchr0004g40207 [Zizania palustris]